VDPSTLRPRIIRRRCIASHPLAIAVELKVTLATVMDQHLGLMERTPAMAMASEDIAEFQPDAESSEETPTEQGRDQHVGHDCSQCHTVSFQSECEQQWLIATFHTNHLPP
jgi:hypothetical protein